MDAEQPISSVRIARPTRDWRRIAALYTQGLGWQRLGSFENHAGFDGIMLGEAGAPLHFEWTQERGAAAPPRPHPDDLVVLYCSSRRELDARAQRAITAGFEEVAAHNPYWQACGRTLQDFDGYRVVFALPPSIAPRAEGE